MLLPQHTEPHWRSQGYLKPTDHMVRKREREVGIDLLPRLALLGFDVIEWLLLT